jgi:hypothetical protein
MPIVSRRHTQADRLPETPEQTKAQLSGRFNTPERLSPDVHLTMLEPNGEPQLVTNSEEWVAGWLRAKGLEFLKELHQFTVPDGQDGFEHFRPDFYVPEWNVYLELTDGIAGGRPERRRHRKVEYLRECGVPILLLNSEILGQITGQKITLLEYVLASAEAHADQLYDELMAEAATDETSAA